MAKVTGPNQNLTLTLNEPPVLTLTLNLTPTKPKCKIPNLPKMLGPIAQLPKKFTKWYLGVPVFLVIVDPF